MAMMEEETRQKRGWLSALEFSRVLAVCKLFPGPVATQMAIYLGLLRGGRWGGLLAGLLFILPSFFLVLGLSWIYVHSGLVTQAGAFLGGIQSAALVVIAFSVVQLARSQLGARSQKERAIAWSIALLSAAIVALRPAIEPIVIFGAGLLGVWVFKNSTKNKNQTPKLHSWSFPIALSAAGIAGPPAVASALAATALAPIANPALTLFWTCLKAGVLVFGTGLAVVPMLEADVVTRLGWLTRSEFMDGLAIGQATPGPVVITATFIGYKALGLWGACVATLGIFLPAFFNVLVLVPLVWERWLGHPATEGFTRFAIPAVLGSIFGTALRLGALTLAGPIPWVVFFCAAGIAWRLKPPAWLLIPGAGFVQMLLFWLF